MIRVTVLAVRGGKVTLGFDVEGDVPEVGSEVMEDQDASDRPHPQMSRNAWAKAESDRWEDDGG
jgi:hypothetical protein